jgi:hypothetical protein
MQDISSKRSHSKIGKDNVNGANDDYDQYQREEEMPLEGNNGAMIDTDNEVETWDYAVAAQVNTEMIDTSIDVTNTTNTVVQTDNVIGGDDNQPNRSLMQYTHNISKITIK